MFVIPSGNTAIAAKTNCNSVNKTYPFGIALNKQSIGTSKARVNRTKYIQLKYLDRDLDGIVCETEKLQTKVATSSTTVPRTTAATIPRQKTSTVPQTTATTTSSTSTTTTISATTTTQHICVNGGACSVGDRGPGGGTVFYDAGSAQTWGRYLEVAPNDLGGYTWNVAMSVAQAYTGGGLSDWRLPTKDELNLLFTNQHVVGSFSAAATYWSITEASNNRAWTMDFRNGMLDPGWKTFTLVIARPVRAF